MSRKKISEQLENARKKQNLTQSELSEKSKVSMRTIGNIKKTGKADISILQKLANALKIDFTVFYERKL